MAEFYDVTAEDYEENNFPADVLNQDDAISQALKLFLISAPDDFIYREDNGGIIKTMLFKQLNDSNVQNAKFRIKNAIINGFFPAITILNIDIQKDVNRKAWVITIVFQSPFTEVPQQTKILIKDLSDRDRDLKTVEIPYMGNNLTNFAKLQKFKYPDDRLLFKEGKYTFNKYILINFNKYSDNFQEVSNILG